ncbi:MAG: transporter [Pseudomonadota bacterium]
MSIKQLLGTFAAMSSLAMPAGATEIAGGPPNHPMPADDSKVEGSPDGAMVSPPSTGAPAAPSMEMSTPTMGRVGLTPPGIMTGASGTWMLGYRYSIDRMDGNLVGGRHVSDAAVASQFMATPTDMTMQMHMVSLMFAPTDRLTVMGMIPYVIKSMDHVTGEGERFTERAKGLGDIEVSASYVLYSQPDLRHRLLATMGASLPTGSINQRMEGMRQEYPMQLGAGTVALRPGFIYLGQDEPWGWGAKLLTIVQLGQNTNGYRLGNRYEASLWGSRLVTPSVSLLFGLNGEVRRNIRGADPMLDPLDEPTKDPLRQGGRRLDASVGVAFHPQAGTFRGNELFLRLDAPIAQSLDGPQLKRRWGLRLELQREF